MSITPATVLIVDDDPALLRGLGRSLAEGGFEVLTAISAAEAAVILRHHNIEIVVCDQRMPGLTGIDFLSDVRRECPHIVTILLSGHVSGLPVARQAAREAGIHEILSKPCSAAELTQAIELALQREFAAPR